MSSGRCVSGRRRTVRRLGLGLWIGLGVLLAAAGVQGVALSGSGAHLSGPVSSTNPIPISPVILSGPDTGPFTGTWVGSVPPAAPAWGGTFAGTGPFTGGGGPSGSTTVDYSGMINGYLPTGTYVLLSDLDGGSGVETITLKAYDSTHTPLTTWLDTPVAIYGVHDTLGGGLPDDSTDTASWSWNAISSTYTLTGNSLLGVNPAITILLPTNQNIFEIDFTRDTNFAGTTIAAPQSVPEPATAGLICTGVVALLSRSRKAWGHR